MSLGPIAGPIVGGILAAAVTTSGAIAINKIKNEKFNAGVPPSAPVIAAVPKDITGESGSGAGNSSGVNRGTLFSTGMSQTSNAVPGQNANINQPLRAYVLISDINTQQQLEKSIESKSTF